jgi:antitoxin YokJ
VKIEELLEAISSDGRCVVKPSIGLPKINPSILLPQEIIDFYSLCGGIEFFTDEDYCCFINSPNDFTFANGVALRELSESDVLDAFGADHFSWSWYYFAHFDTLDDIIAVSVQGDDVLSCYDCYWSSYPNKNRKISSSVSEMIEKIYLSGGKIHYHEIFGL